MRMLNESWRIGLCNTLCALHSTTCPVRRRALHLYTGLLEMAISRQWNGFWGMVPTCIRIPSLLRCYILISRRGWGKQHKTFLYWGDEKLWEGEMEKKSAQMLFGAKLTGCRRFFHLCVKDCVEETLMMWTSSFAYCPQRRKEEQMHVKRNKC